MKQIKFRSEKNKPKLRRVKRILKKLAPFILVISLLTALAFFLTTLSGSDTIVRFNLLGKPIKSTDEQVNILLLGIAGGVHDGSSLTDTILVASYNLKTNQVYLFSIPRDLWLPELRSKANAVYQLGISQNNGLDFSKTIMGNVLGIPIHYALRVDFRGFVQGIDTLGGIEVMVARSFDDYLYPIQGAENDLCGFEGKEIEFSEEQAKELNIEKGKRKVFVSPDGKIATDSAQEDKGLEYFSCRYEHISFEKGQMQMNGAIALKYVRSRHGTYGEGSDFARSARQEKVLQAIREKVLSPKTLFDISKVTELIKTLGKSIDTDISGKDAFEFYKLSKKLEGIHMFTIDDSILIHPNPQDYGGAYVLISQDDDFSVIHKYVKKILEGQISEYEATSSARPGN